MTEHPRPPTGGAPDRIDAYLTNKAQHGLDPRAVVLERCDGTWLLELPGQPARVLGAHFAEARRALQLLIRSGRSTDPD
jgi:hypothetical protein